MDKMREEFEAWVRCRGGDVMKRDKEYVSSMTREWWQAWQASRQALVVDVDSLPSASYTDDGVIYRSHVEDALHAAGVSTK